ncbi:maltose ABC transporter substrate-binding protein [Paenibacillus melissococcoides]|uniref:Maltose ABC transporter substrate-binding protein n=1 Tax=Paenibacillus melissococcoides TaxID=2912268 RepID=A0ABM9G0Y6_9BACL|nr:MULTISPECIES: maltose ABC transporter substrate-binding protein [Paenibacillus]MEB9895309.1 maltose ABC transporter substrate-binding protein [Bacillus cereus]CAH8244977.1 maltose ABC transporter substrate-binding protein [Paenibacillus melissococcoides]CAH8709540.1 maltose ABC transporter substrate-binding protein [Paenibacillus melissococcoides]CAH8710267.1 maltose ABC transporter substrate-binding protein [Paenibacillus melissococcoides]GIO78339.1 cyclodextrin-binding protein [Paenibacil
MKGKKLGSLFIVMVMMLLMMSACGPRPDSGAPATEEPAAQGEANETASGGGAAGDEELVPEPGAKLVIWEGPEQKEFLEAMAQEFTAKYDIPVEIQEIGSGEQMAKVKTDGPAGLGADIMVLPHDHLGEAVAAGLVMPNDFYAEDTMNNFAPAAVEAVSLDGIIYGYPRNMETYLLYYNKDLVKEEDLASWDRIIAFAKKYNDAKNNKFGFLYEVNNFYYNYAFMAGNGAYVFGKKGTDPADIGLAAPEAVEAFQFFQSLREAIPIKAADASGDVKTSLFQTGKLPINMDGIWQLGNFTKEKLGFEVGAVPLPPMPNGKAPKPFLGVKAYFVSTFSQYPNAAKLFIHHVTSQEAMVKNYELSGIIPARNGMENEPAIQANPNALAFLEQFKNVEAMPYIIEMRSVWGPLTATLEPIWDGGNVEAILKKAVEDVKTAIAQQG